MARFRFFSHIDQRGRGPAGRVKSVERKVGREGFTDVGENIAAGFGTSRGACRAWLRSPGHRANLLNSRFGWVGGGVSVGGPYGHYYVQVFARKRR